MVILVVMVPTSMNFLVLSLQPAIVECADISLVGIDNFHSRSPFDDLPSIDPDGLFTEPYDLVESMGYDQNGRTALFDKTVHPLL